MSIINWTQQIKRLHALYELTLREENYITAEYLKEQFLHQGKPTPTLIELYQAVCESKEELQGKTIRKATGQGFQGQQEELFTISETRGNEDCLPKEADKD